MGKLSYYAAAAMLCVFLGGGCSMCQVCELETYSAYGGRWQRTDRDHGRVASVFAPAGAQVPYDGPPDSVGSGLLAPAPATDREADEETGPEQAAPSGDDEDPAMPPADDLEQREQRLRELDLEDIRYQQ